MGADLKIVFLDGFQRPPQQEDVMRRHHWIYVSKFILLRHSLDISCKFVPPPGKSLFRLASMCHAPKFQPNDKLHGVELRQIYAYLETDIEDQWKQKNEHQDLQQ